MLQQETQEQKYVNMNSSLNQQQQLVWTQLKKNVYQKKSTCVPEAVCNVCPLLCVGPFSSSSVCL